MHDDVPPVAEPVVPPSTDDFTILSHLALPGRASDADIALYDHGGKGLFAYVGSWRDRCRNDGVKIVDVTQAPSPGVVADREGARAAASRARTWTSSRSAIGR